MKKASLSRRDMLKGLAATAVGAPLVISSTALGDGTTPPASERITLGHIGVGNKGGELIGGFRACKGQSYQSLAVSDAYSDRRQAFARGLKCREYADFRELLARDDIDAVVIATPDHWHVPMAIAAIRAKKDVYVEKPLGVTIEQDLAMQKAAAASDRIVQYGTQQRSLKHCQFGCELVRSGRIGKVHTIEVTAPNGGSGGSTQTIAVPPTLNYDMWCGPSPVRPYTADRCHPNGTYWIYDYSIGYLGGWGAHPLDIMILGSDADIAGPMTVEGTGEIPSQGLYDVVYNWDMKIQLGDGVRMTFKPGGDSTKFIGTEGWVAISRNTFDAEPKSLFVSKLEPVNVPMVETNGRVGHCENFLESIKSRKPPRSTVSDAVRSDVISNLCNIAVRTKRKITWDPKTQTIVGDDAAAALMHRELRDPWTL